MSLRAGSGFGSYDKRVVTCRRAIRVVTDALAAANAEGIIHRDVKPANSFEAKPAERLSVINNIVRQEFQCDEAIEFCVFGLVDDTHAAATQLLEDPIMRDGLPIMELKEW